MLQTSTLRVFCTTSVIALQSTLNKQFCLYPLAKSHGDIFAYVHPTATANKCVHPHSILREVYWNKPLPRSSLLQQHDGQQHKPALSKQTVPCQHARRVCFPPQRSRKVAQSAGIRKCGEKMLKNIPWNVYLFNKSGHRKKNVVFNITFSLKSLNSSKIKFTSRPLRDSNIYKYPIF